MDKKNLIFEPGDQVIMAGKNKPGRVQRIGNDGTWVFVKWPGYRLPVREYVSNLVEAEIPRPECFDRYTGRKECLVCGHKVDCRAKYRFRRRPRYKGNKW
jgi:hypothetical protein